MSEARWKYQLNVDLLHKTWNAGPAFQNPWLSIQLFPDCGDMRCHIIVSRPYRWDGCTGVPDAAGTHDASCIHDAIYQFAEQIAAASGWTVRAVLHWADEIFEERMLDDSAGDFVTVLYSAGVRLFGYSFHQACRWLLGPADHRMGIIRRLMQ